MVSKMNEKNNHNKSPKENAMEIKKISERMENAGSEKTDISAEPVNRASLKNMDLGLEGKIIPKTEEMERIEIPEDATFEEKTELINQKRKKKVENFVLKDEEEKSTEKKETNPVKNQSKASRKNTERESKQGGQREFENFKDANKIHKDILQVKNNLFVRLVVLIFTGFFSFLITFANDFELPLLNIFNRRISPASYIFTLTMLGIVSVGVSYTVLVMGIKNLFKRKGDCDSIAAINIVISVISGLLTLLHPESVREGNFHIYISVAILGLLCNTVGKILIVKRTEENFRYVAGEFERYAVTNVDNEDAANNFTRGYLSDFPELSTMRRTEFIEDFMKNSYSPDVADTFAAKASPVILIGGAVLGLLSLIFDTATGVDKILSAFAACSGLLSMCCSFSLMIYINYALSRASNKFLKYSSVMLGYSAVDEFADTNSVLVDASELFPEGMIDLVNLKVLSAASIEECILMAASLSCQAGSILQTAFYKMLKGKTEMLYPVESYIFEDGLGLTGWIENKRVLLGNRKLMENHSIDGLPSLEKEKQYSKNGNAVVYLSISGIATTLFVVRAIPGLAVSGWLQELENENIVTVIRTIDGFLSKEFISSLFGISPDSIKLLPFRYHKDYEKETEYSPRISSPMICSGHFPSFAMLIIGAKRLKYTANLGTAVQFGMSVLGGTLSLIMMIAGAFSQISPSVAICYNLVFLLISLLIPKFQKI